MANATSMFDVSLDQTMALIAAGGNKRTVLVQGHMGTGKSSLLRALGKKFPKHECFYFDCTTKDVGDIAIPQLHHMDEHGFVRFVPNEELGIHLGKPIILMIDEYGKANPAVKLAMLRLMLERETASCKLHPESMVFATTNKGAENVGDLLPPHARNRLTIVTVRKPNHMEWLEWGVNNGVDHTLLGWVKDNPQLFQSFEDVRDPEENQYIFHPKSNRTAFVTPRSLEAASDWLKVRSAIDDHTLTSALIGSIGEKAAMELSAFVAMSDDLPSLQSIKDDPMGAKVPQSDAAVCMVVYRTMSVIERDWVDAWMVYLSRLDAEAQGLFANGVRSDKYSKKAMVMNNKKFMQWALANNYMFASDVV